MPKFAYFDHTTPAPQRIMGWYDTDFVDYPNLPDPADLFEMTQAQWDARSLSPSALDNGEIVVLPTPPLPPQQAADQEFATRQANGIALTCTSNSAINATYPLDDRSFAMVGAIARDAASGLGLPHGAATVSFPDLNSASHDFTETQTIDFYKAMRDLLNLMNAQRDIMGKGDTPVWPDQSVTIP